MKAYNRKKWFIGVCLFLTLSAIAAGIWRCFYVVPYEEFYPQKTSNETLQEARQFFFHRQYLNLTSFVNQVLSNGMSHPKEREELLFWEAESYFQMGQYKLAQTQFATLLLQDPHLWQASLRLVAIDIIQKKPIDFWTRIKTLPPSQERDYWIGQFYESQNQINEALAVYREISPPNASVLWRMGVILFQKGGYGESLPLLERALKDGSISRLELLKMIFHDAVALQDRQAVIKYSNALKMYLSDSPVLFLEVVQSLIHLGELEQARSLFTTIDPQMQITPSFASVLVDLNFRLKNYPDVIHYARYSSLNSEHYLALLESYFQLHQNHKLLMLSAKNKRKYPLSVQWKISDYRARAYESLGHSQNAIRERLKMDTLNPKNEKNLWNLLSLYAKTHQPRWISPLAERLYFLAPQRISDIMSVLMSFSLWTPMTFILAHILDVNPNREDALYWKAKVLAGQKHWDQMKEVLLRLVQISPKDQQIAYYAYYSLGMLSLKRHWYAQAVNFLQDSEHIAPSNSLDVKLALAYLLNGDKDKAEATIRNIKQEDPLSPEERKIISKINQLTHQPGQDSHQ